MLLHWDKDERVIGLLISTSDLTSNGKQALRAFQKTRDINVRIWLNISEGLSSHGDFLSVKELRTIIREKYIMLLGDDD